MGPTQHLRKLIDLCALLDSEPGANAIQRIYGPPSHVRADANQITFRADRMARHGLCCTTCHRNREATPMSSGTSMRAHGSDIQNMLQRWHGSLSRATMSMSCLYLYRWAS